MWSVQQLDWNVLGQWGKFNRKQVWTLTKACRLVAANFMMQNPDANKIGGLDENGKPIVVQVDETFCGKVKYHRGKGRTQTWVLGGVESTEKNCPKKTPRYFALTVPNRKKETLIPILKIKIKEQSIVQTDGWRAYYTLGKHFAKWDMVNHTKMFCTPEGVNTNTCEGRWTHLKKTIPWGTKREKIEEYVQLHNFNGWAKCHPDYQNLGLFGVLARACNNVQLQDMGRQGDSIANSTIAEGIVAANPLPESELPRVSHSKKPKGRGRPCKKRRGNTSSEI